MTLQLVLDPIEICTENADEMSFISWYDSNKHLTKQAMMLGYHIIRDGIETYIGSVDESQKHREIELLKKRHQAEVAGIQERHAENVKRLKESMKEVDIGEMALLQAEKKVAAEMLELHKYKVLYNDLKARQDLAQNDDREQVIHALTREIGMLKKTNFAKGNKGENLILNMLRQVYTAWEFKDTSKDKHAGDIHMIAPNGSDLYMIESKYKEIITKQDVDKFYSDITHLQETGRNVVCGIFVSILTKNIPHIGEMSIDFCQGVPVIFVGFQDEEEFDRWFKQYVQLGIQLVAFQKNNGGEQKQNLEDIIRQISPLIDQVKCMKNMIEKLRSTYLSQVNNTVADLEVGIKKLFDSLGCLGSLGLSGGLRSAGSGSFVTDADTSVGRAEDGEELGHICGVCNASFRSARSLGSHMKKHKSSEKRSEN
jgi:hypothetical protein